MLRFLGVLLIFASAGVLGTAHAIDDAARISTNPEFADGLKGWQIEGDVQLASDTANPSKHAVTIGPGAGFLSQRIVVGAMNHMMVKATLQPGSATLAKISVRCLDKDGHELMTLGSPTDIEPGKEPGTFADYFRPHPLTASVEINVAKAEARGSVIVDRLELLVYNDDDAALTSRHNTADLMSPFWQGSVVRDEAVLLTSHNGEAATGTLMFRPKHILSVRSYDGATLYQEGIDYTLQGRTIIAAANSHIGQLRSADLLKGDLAWNIVGGKQVLVTYEHEDEWTGPVQPYVGKELPNTLRILRMRGALRIVAYGDSITYGVGSSHMQKIRPYRAPWVDLLAGQLGKEWNDPAIELFNASQSGADSGWAQKMAGRMVASLRPDLVLIAFGQNDFWRISPDAFAANLANVMRIVRAAHPQTEFLLISTMRFDPAYSVNPAYWQRVAEYDQRLRAMTTAGVQLVDMTAISGAVFAAKAPKDCLNDPLHPNDYLSRWYAQSVVAALTPEENAPGEGSAEAPFSGKKGVGDDDQGSPEAIDATGSHWYYNWTPRPSKGETRAEFVPMLWGAGNVDADLRAAEQTGAKALLAFNEPDSATEGTVSVQEALTLWPKLEATGLRLGSPATTTGSPWLDEFMTQAKARKLRVDFLCLHWYGDITAPDPVGELQKYLLSYWDRYHLPIWLTEFSGADFSFHHRHATVADNARFAAAAAAMLEQLPFVERYAWFGTAWTPNSKDYPTSGLYNNATHALTPVGVAWRGVHEP
ncbi:MAG: glycosyl hydrolase [Acidobacteriota bacterium]